ncbi:MAG: histidine--tRNA ligase [Patescibacteria group bacterium]
MVIQTLKGFRDFLPKEAKKRQYVLDTLKKVFESYGFEPLETPSLEYEEILLGKYGSEGDKLMYRFEDNGKRKVALRYDQTVPLARVVAQYQNELPMPFKRYQIQNVWRAENTQKGRYREFLQCDIDTVGSNSISTDAEIIACILDATRKLNFKGYSMRINDRQIFKNYNLSPKAIVELDKTDKEGPIVFLKQLMLEGKSNQEGDAIFDAIVKSKQTKNIQDLFSVLRSMGYKEGRNKDFWFDQTLARGLDYYTGLIFELRMESYGALSIGGGGRYDNLIGMFAGKQIPAVGFAFGFDRLVEAMGELNLFPKDLQTTKVLVTIFSPELLSKSAEITALLRAKGINTEIYLEEDAKMDKQLKYADKKQIPYVVIIGPDEVSKNMVTLKNMQTRGQKTIPQNEIEKLLAS